MISTTTLFLFSILFFRFEDTAELTHNCILYKVCFYDIYLSNISKNKISKFSNDRIWTYEVVTLNLEFNWFDRSQTLLFALKIFNLDCYLLFRYLLLRQLLYLEIFYSCLVSSDRDSIFFNIRKFIGICIIISNSCSYFFCFIIRFVLAKNKHESHH